MLARVKMAESAGRVLEGVFAVTKPQTLSSAQVLRDLQHSFSTSDVFRPLLRATEETEKLNKQRSKRRRVDNQNAFKMGHGGTLDPLATGVLIVGIGRGTKSLQSFLYCTKTYETVVLFGKSTDTYDVAGKVVALAQTSQITKELVQSKLKLFRGPIKQVPPIYSALKIDGMKAYDYARSGKELPRELAAREMDVSECVMTEWYEPGQHTYRWPMDEASEDEKRAFKKLVHGVDESAEERVSVSELEKLEEVASNSANLVQRKETSPRSVRTLSKDAKAALHTHELNLSDSIADGPAARVRLTVSSGFYVRSFAHDLGLACDSYGTMAELARTRQSDYSSREPTPDGLVPALEYADLGKGENVWGPKITKVLNSWLDKNPPVADQAGQRGSYTRSTDDGSSVRRGKSTRGGQTSIGDSRKRRNSSSPEA